MRSILIFLVFLLFGSSALATGAGRPYLSHAKAIKGLQALCINGAKRLEHVHCGR